MEYPANAVIKTIIHEIPASSLPPPEPEKKKERKRKRNVVVPRREYNYREWTEDETQILIRMYTEGASFPDIVEAVRHTDGAVQMKITKLKRQGLIKVERRPSKWTPEMDDILLRMRPQGVTFSKIGEMVGKSAQAAYCRYQKLTEKDEEEEEYEEEGG